MKPEEDYPGLGLTGEDRAGTGVFSTHVKRKIFVVVDIQSTITLIAGYESQSLLKL